MIEIILAAALIITIAGIVLMVKAKPEYKDETVEEDMREIIDEAVIKSENDLLTEENVNKTSNLKKTLSEEEYMNIHGLIKDGNKLKHVAAKYFNGHPLIDLEGNPTERRFYIWMDESSIYMLDTVISERNKTFEILLKDIVNYSLLNNSVTTLEFVYNQTNRRMFLDGSVYMFLSRLIPEKRFNPISLD